MSGYGESAMVMPEESKRCFGIEWRVRVGPWEDSVSVENGSFVMSLPLGMAGVPDGVVVVQDACFRVDVRSGAEVSDCYVPDECVAVKRVVGRKMDVEICVEDVGLGEDGLPCGDSVDLRLCVGEVLERALWHGYNYVYGVTFLGVNRFGVLSISPIVFCAR